MKIESTIPLENTQDLTLAYSPGVAEPCRAISKDPATIYDYTFKSHTVAVISDGSAVLGLGNIGPGAAMPVMEGKCLLLKKFAGIDAFPICLDTQDTEKIIETIKNIAPAFGAINLEDISAPRCFEIERRLDEELNIPIFHDDQHGTAIVTLAGLINALKITNRQLSDSKIVICGAGAAGTAIARLLHAEGAKHIIILDSKGIISENRPDLISESPQLSAKKSLLEISNPENVSGNLAEALQNADIFIGTSVANVLTPEHISEMKSAPIIFAMANPDPEITPELAKESGAAIIATGRSDYPNQINNVLAFPGVLKAALHLATNNPTQNIRITQDHKIAAAHKIASLVPSPTADNIVPNPFMEGLSDHVFEAIIQSNN